MDQESKSAMEARCKLEAHARELDPMAWNAHAFSTSDEDLKHMLARRRSTSMLQAASMARVAARH